MTRTLPAVLCTFALAMTAACGGGGDEAKQKVDPAQAARTSYLTAADKICAAQLVKIEALGKGLTNDSPTAAKDAAFAKAGDGFLEEVKLVKALTPPASMASDVDAWLTSLTAAATKVKKQGSKLVGSADGSPFADADAKATALGFEKCLSTAS